jgi:hypothetical protein
MLGSIGSDTALSVADQGSTGASAEAIAAGRDLVFEGLIEAGSLAESYSRSLTEAAWRGDRSTVEVHLRQLRACIVAIIGIFKQLDGVEAKGGGACRSSAPSARRCSATRHGNVRPAARRSSPCPRCARRRGSLSNWARVAAARRRRILQRRPHSTANCSGSCAIEAIRQGGPRTSTGKNSGSGRMIRASDALPHRGPALKTKNWIVSRQIAFIKGRRTYG